MIKNIRFALLALCCAHPISIGLEAAEFVPLGDFPEGLFASSAAAISDDGTAILGFGTYDDSGRVAVFRWTANEGMHPLADFARDIMPGGVSNNGAIAVGHERVAAPITENAIRWSSVAGLNLLPDFPANVYSRAEDISPDGAFIVGGTAAGVISTIPEAFLWNADSGTIGLGDLPGGEDFSNAVAVSADGRAVAGYSGSANDSHIEAFRWTEATGIIGLGDLSSGEFSSYAENISADGNVVVGFSETSPITREAFRWSADTGMVGLGELPGYEKASGASAANHDGSVIVGAASPESGTAVAIVWDESHGLKLFQDVLIDDFGLGDALSGWSLRLASDISADGLSIVGQGRNPNGDFEAYLVRLDRPLTAPEPSSLALVLSAVILAALRRRRR